MRFRNRVVRSGVGPLIPGRHGDHGARSLGLDASCPGVFLTTRSGSSAKVWGFLALGILAVDQATKSWVAGLPSNEVIRLFGGAAVIHVTRNGGGPLGLWRDGGPIFTYLSVLGLVSAGLVARRAAGARIAIPAGIIAGGALGNLTDRLLRHPGWGHGQVVDWIRVAVYPYTFNLADVALRLGALVFIVTVVAGERHRPSDSVITQGSARPARRFWLSWRSREGGVNRHDRGHRRHECRSSARSLPDGQARGLPMPVRA